MPQAICFGSSKKEAGICGMRRRIQTANFLSPYPSALLQNLIAFLMQFSSFRGVLFSPPLFFYCKLIFSIFSQTKTPLFKKGVCFSIYSFFLFSFFFLFFFFLFFFFCFFFFWGFFLVIEFNHISR